VDAKSLQHDPEKHAHYDPMGGCWFSEKITLKQRGQIMIRFDRTMS